MPISLKCVSKSFARRREILAPQSGGNRREVLREVTLEVDKGEITCVLGKNGNGKTTMIRILSTLIEPDSGEAKICGYDVAKKGHEVRRRVGVMLNAGEGGFHSRLSAHSNLEYYATLYRIPLKEARVRIRKLLQDLGLDDRGTDQIQSYSSGMRRRLALVRALLPDPPVLLLDEPTLGVDPWTKRRIHDHLVELSRQGITVLCTTNDLLEARAFGNPLYVLENGTMTESKIQEVEVS